MNGLAAQGKYRLTKRNRRPSDGGPALRIEHQEPAVSRRGKVRDMYAVGDDRLLIVTTDRLSAFDVVLPDRFPAKAKCSTKCPTSGSRSSRISFQSLNGAAPETVIKRLGGILSGHGPGGRREKLKPACRSRIREPLITVSGAGTVQVIGNDMREASRTRSWTFR